jgi:acetyltransferase
MIPKSGYRFSEETMLKQETQSPVPESPPPNGAAAPLTAALPQLLQPKAIAVIGASQRGGRGTNVIANLVSCGYGGEILAVNPRYTEILGHRCVPAARELPAAVECIVVAVGAESACDVLEEAFAHGIRAAIVLSAGFGEGGHGGARGDRLRALAARGMCICGPNCLGLINVKTGMAAYSGPLMRPLRAGPVTLVSQSGGLGASVFAPLMTDRELGFSHFISCGNQLGATIEDYVEHLLDDPDVTVAVCIVEALTNPKKLAAVARTAHARRKSLVFFQVGRSAAGRALTQAHTGALVDNGDILAAFLRSCGILQVATHDELVETVELLANAPRDAAVGRGVVVISGSGGGAAVAADVLADAGVPLAPLQAATRERIAAVMPEFGSVTNPIDATGSMYDDATLLPKLLDAILAEPGRPVIAASVNARPAGNAHMRRFATTIAEVARVSGRTMVAFQYSPLGGPLDAEVVRTLHAANVPFLLGTSNAMRAVKALGQRAEYWARAAQEGDGGPAHGVPATAGDQAWDFLSARERLVASGVPVVAAELARSEDEAATIARRLATPVAVKAEAPGLLHKSDIGCVALGCAGEDAVRRAFRTVTANCAKAGFGAAGALIQPMVSGVAEAYAGIIDDPLFGPAVCFGMGGIFVEILHDATIEMAPLSREVARGMIARTKAARLLDGARGCGPGDVAALVDLLVRLGDFATAHAGAFRALDLNPIIVGAAGAGVAAVDIAIEERAKDKP